MEPIAITEEMPSRGCRSSKVASAHWLAATYLGGQAVKKPNHSK
jgi:hypothetical protein